MANSSNFVQSEIMVNSETNETILSVSYNKGRISCSFYKFESLELYVSYEACDPLPHFSYLQNIFRKNKPSYVLASGPIQLYKKILKLLDYPDNIDPYLFRASNKKNQSANFLIYQHNVKNLHINRQKILLIDLPGMDENWSQSERSIFLNSILPLNQELVIQSLGNLYNYLDTNWHHIYMRQNNNINSSNNNKLIITDLKVFYLESQVLIDESVLKSLQIFTDIHHPSDYKKHNIKEGHSIYNLLNRCSSKMGKNMLKNLLLQPIRDINELELRYSTINWFIEQKTIKCTQNFEKFQKYLKNINDISICFKNMQLKPNCIKYWKIFKETIYSAYVIMNLCIECTGNIDEIKPTMIKIIADAGKTDFNVLGNTLLTIDKIVDIDESDIQNYFVVKHNLDSLLDEKREKMLKLQDNLSEAILYEGYHLPEFVTNIEGYYIPEIGYVIKIKTIDNNPPIASLESDTLKFLVQNYNEYYFKTSLCDELNVSYGNIYFDIRDHEQIICKSLLDYLNQSLPVVQNIVKLCGKLDYLMAFSLIAIEKKLIKPILTTDKCIIIKNGRHILCEQIYNYIPTDTNISYDNKNIITILTAPNESGKSVYMKQIGLITYLAHIGCYVPATYAKIFLLDSIYTRLHTPESTYYNCSSFLSDLQQMSKIISYSTDKSLILIDEFGTGTQIIEGKSLLVSCIEDLSSRLINCPIVLISTHYSDIYQIINNNINKNIEWKTFINKLTTDDLLISTYKLTNGININLKYAYQIYSVKEFFKKFLNTNNNQDSLLRMNEIHGLKSDLAFEIIQQFILNEKFNINELLKEFNEYIYIME